MKTHLKTEYFCLEPASFKLDGGAMFGIIPKPLWNKVHAADPLNRIELALRLVVIKKENKIILIDTGIGDYQEAKFNERFAVVGEQNPLEKALASIQLTTDDITDVIISHLHFDHAGGLGKMTNSILSPVFKNATIHLHKKHYEYSFHPTERDAGSFQLDHFQPIIEWYRDHHKLHFVDGMEGPLIAGLHFKCSMGHTPYLLHAHDDKFIYMADLIPTSNHINIPWVMGYDISPGITTQDKKHFLQFILENNLTMIFEHDPQFYGTTIKQNEKHMYVCDKLLESKKSYGYSVL